MLPPSGKKNNTQERHAHSFAASTRAQMSSSQQHIKETSTVDEAEQITFLKHYKKNVQNKTVITAHLRLHCSSYTILTANLQEKFHVSKKLTK